MKYILIISSLISLASCSIEKKASSYYDNHPEKLAEKCISRFPVKESSDTIVSTIIDSNGYNIVINELIHYSDSLLDELKSWKESDFNVNLFNNENKLDKDTILYFGGIDSGIVYYSNINKLKKSIESKIKNTVKPCSDSTTLIKIRVEDSRKIEIKDDIISKRDKTISDINDRLSKKEVIIKHKNKAIIILSSIIAILVSLFLFRLKLSIFTKPLSFIKNILS